MLAFFKQPRHATMFQAWIKSNFPTVRTLRNTQPGFETVHVNNILQRMLPDLIKAFIRDHGISGDEWTEIYFTLWERGALR